MIFFNFFWFFFKLILDYIVIFNFCKLYNILIFLCNYFILCDNIYILYSIYYSTYLVHI